MGTIHRSRSALFSILATFVVIAFSWQLVAQQGSSPTKKTTADKEEKTPPQINFRFSGPFTHENLTLYLIHGQDQLKNKDFLILAEALKDKKVVVHETQNVNTLKVENLSDKEIILLAGDILKGGQQDRVVTYDMILPPKSGKVDLAVFCVELTAPRWMRKYQDGDKKFAGSMDVLAGKDLRKANWLYLSQGAVWDNVKATQKKLSKNVATQVMTKESPSSLQLSLSVKEVREAAEKYTSELGDITKGKNDVIGYAFAINGKVYGADVYGSNTLFQKVWPRLIRSNAIESVAELQKGKKFQPVQVADVKNFLVDAKSGKVSQKEIGNGLQRLESKAKNNAVFESYLPNKKISIRGFYLAY